MDDVHDLTALKERFPDARLETLENGERRLVLADTPFEMPYKTHVDVKFIPTILVENTTPLNQNGTVSVTGGSFNAELDGRYPETLVFGSADENYMVDMDNLQIGNVGGVHSNVLMNLGAVDIIPDSEGYYSAEVTLDIAGKKEDLIITGKVTVLERDTYGNPTRISISVSELPSCLDIGIPFITAKTPEDIPPTGDPVEIVGGIAGSSALALILLHILDKRKKRA